MYLLKRNNSYYFKIRIFKEYFVKSLKTDSRKKAQHLAYILANITKEFIKMKLDLREIRHFLEKFTDKFLQETKEDNLFFKYVCSNKNSELDELLQTSYLKNFQIAEKIDIETLKSELIQSKKSFLEDAVINGEHERALTLLKYTNENKELKDYFVANNKFYKQMHTVKNLDMYEAITNKTLPVNQDDLHFHFNREENEIDELTQIKYQKELVKIYHKAIKQKIEDTENILDDKKLYNFEEFIDIYIQHLKDKKENEQSISRKKRDLKKVLRTISSNKKLYKYDFEDFKQIVKRLEQYPLETSISSEIDKKLKKWEDVLEYKKANNIASLSLTTVNKILSLLNNFFDYAVLTKQIKYNYFKVKELKTDDYKNVEENNYRAWTTEEIRTYLTKSSHFTNKLEEEIYVRPFSIFAVLIIIFSGCRSSEASGLTLEDIYEDDEKNLWLDFDIKKDEDNKKIRSLKTKSSIRTICLNKIVAEKLGFKKYIEIMNSCFENSRENIFKLNFTKRKISGEKLTRNFGVQKNKIFDDETLVLHGFRATVSTILREKYNFQFDAIESITGHVATTITETEKKQLASVLRKVYMSKNIKFIKEKIEVSNLKLYENLDDVFEDLSVRIHKILDEINNDLDKKLCFKNNVYYKSKHK